MLKILLGAVGSGKTETVLRTMTQTAHEKRFARIWVLLATRRQEQDFRHRLIDYSNDQKFYFNIEFFNFYDLYQRLLNSGRVPAWRIGAASRYGLLRTVIQHLKASGELELFASVAETPGFVRVVAAFIDELKQNRVDPQMFAGMAGSQKDRELGAIYAGYQELLIRHRLVDRDGEGWLALDVIDEQPEIARNVDLLVVDGYDQFTLVQAELILRLSEWVDETLVTLPTAPGRESTLGRRFRQTFERLQEGSIEGQFIVETLDTDGAYSLSHPQLTHLCRTLMLPYAPKLDLTDQPHRERYEGVFMIEAPDAAEEVAAALRRVKRLLLEGVSPEQIMVVLRDWEHYQPQFASLARAYQIPLVLHYGDRLSEIPLITTLLKLLQLHRDDFPRRELMDVLRSPYLHIPGITAEQSGLIEWIAQQQIILGGRSNWLEGILRAGRPRPMSQPADLGNAGITVIDVDSDDEDVETHDLLNTEEAEQLVQSLELFFENVTPPRNATVEDYILWLEGLIGDDPLNIPDDDEASPTPSGESYSFSIIERVRAIGASDERISSRDLTSLHSLKQTLRSLLEARQLLLNLDEVDIRTVSWEDFHTQLLTAIDAAEINPHPSRSGRVLVTTASNARGLPHQHVLILGLSEGLFPKPAPQDPFYLDSERGILIDNGILLATSAERANDDGVFYELIGLPTHSLTLTRPTAQDGQPWSESHLWRAVRNAFVGLPVHRLRAGDVVPAAEAASLSEVALAVAEALASGYKDGTTPGHEQWLQYNQPDFWSRVQRNREIEADRIADDVPYNHHTGQLQDPKIIADIASQLTSRRQWSASQWNEYGTCPYRFFAARLLKLEKLKPPEEGMDVLQRGTLYHAILQETYQTFIDQSMVISPEQQPMALEILNEIATYLCLIAPERYGFRATALWEQEQKTLIRRLERLVAKDFSEEHPFAKAYPDIERRPYRVEAAFGFEPSEEDLFPPIPFELNLGDAGSVRLRGLIDRIDLVGDRLYIIDYKSGSARFQVSEMRAGRSFQMVIYLLAAQAMLDQLAAARHDDELPRSVAGGAFWHLSNNTLSGEMRLPKDQDVMDSAREKIREYLPAMRAGRFVVEPGENSGELCTHYCDFYDLCRLCKLGVTKT
jgi:ATP-dependent helicase/nuclease subunit B